MAVSTPIIFFTFSTRCCHLLYFILHFLLLSPHVSISYHCCFCISFCPFSFQFSLHSLYPLLFKNCFCSGPLSCFAFKLKILLMQTLFRRYCTPAQFPPLFLPLFFIPRCKDCGLLLLALCAYHLPISTPHFMRVPHEFYFPLQNL